MRKTPAKHYVFPIVLITYSSVSLLTTDLLSFCSFFGRLSFLFFSSTFDFMQYTRNISDCDHALDLLRSRDVIGNVTIRLARVDFLSVVHGDHASI